MLDTEGYISEASGENIFMVKNGVMKTTPTSILPAITRDSVIQIARAKKIPRWRSDLLGMNSIRLKSPFLQGRSLS